MSDKVVDAPRGVKFTNDIEVDGDVSAEGSGVGDVEKNADANSRYSDDGPNPSSQQYHNLFGVTIDTSIAHSHSSSYDTKAQVLNDAILELGMGRYQWTLILVTGIGWLLDSFWMLAFLIISRPVDTEAQFSLTNIKYLYISQYVGLAIGSLIWPLFSNALGRKTIFNISIALMGVCGLVGAGMSQFDGLCILGAIIGAAIGGNQAVDGMIFAETIPATHSYLLTMQGAFWGLGQLLAAAFGWPLITLYACAVNASQCHYVNNYGWRYTWWCFGCITLFVWVLRYTFRMRESPRYLLSQARDIEAVKSLQDIALYNKRHTRLNQRHISDIDRRNGSLASTKIWQEESPIMALKALSPYKLLDAFTNFRQTGILLLVWALIGLTVPLYPASISTYLQSNVKSLTLPTSGTAAWFRTYIYISIVAIPGPFLAGLLSEVKFLGRRRTGTIFSILTGLFLFLFVLTRSTGALIAFGSLTAFFGFGTLALLFAYTNEVFSTEARGAGVGLTGFVFRILGLAGAIVATFDSSTATLWVCGSFWIVAGCVWALAPIETMGRMTI